MTTSGSQEHAPSEEIEIGSAVHLPLEQLQLVDLALSLTIAPPRLYPGRRPVMMLVYSVGSVVW
jgi:hypothetical protein